MVVLIACVTCAKAKAKCDKKIPCGRCVTKRISCRPRGDRRFSDGQTELSLADIEKIAAATGGKSAIQTPNLSRRPSTGTLCPSRRETPQHSPQSNLETNCSISNPMNIPWPTAQLPSPSSKNHDNDMGNSSPILSCWRFNSSFEQNPTLTSIDPGIIHKKMPLLDHFLPMASDSMQTDIDLPCLDLSSFPECSLYLGDCSFPGSFNDLNLGSSTPTLIPSMNTSSDTLPSLSRGSSADESTGRYRRPVEEHEHFAEVEESWPAFRCNPPRSAASCPPTSGIYLDGLVRLLRNQGAWSSWISRTHLMTPIPAGRVGVESFDDMSRNKLTAVAQSFLYHAFDVHRARSMNDSHAAMSHLSSFMILPPARILGCFLSAYVRQFETYNVCCSGSSLKPNWLLHQSDTNVSSLLVLLMLAYGAAADSTTEARYFSSGLIEVCRISWQNVVERDISLTRDPTALLSGLLLTTLQAWSGDKTFMEVAMGKRDSYINMLRQAGFLEAQPIEAEGLRQHQTIDAAWEQWKLDENKSRLVYAWVALDQEMSLFYDTAPLASISELKTPLPSTTELWKARSATEWWNRYERQQGAASPSEPSLCKLFRTFVEGEWSHNAKLGPTELRLLLHPLQGIISHLRQFLRCFNDDKVHVKPSRMKTKSVTLARQEEIKELLRNWYQLACNSMESSPIMYANLINFHLISLNVLLDFPELERAARGNPYDDATLLLSCIRLIHPDEIEEILMHCGQVLKNIQAISMHFRPHWWPGAHYRVALIAWAVSMTRQFQKGLHDQPGTEQDLVAIDTLVPDHPSISRFLKRQGGVAAFSKADGSLVSLSSPRKVLAYFSTSLEDDLSMRLTDGTRNKLRRLAARWESVMS